MRRDCRLPAPQLLDTYTYTYTYVTLVTHVRFCYSTWPRFTRCPLEYITSFSTSGHIYQNFSSPAAG